MDYVFLSTLGAMTGTLTLILVYVYLYIMYRERYILLWVIAWMVLFLRIILFDSGLFNWKQSILGFIIYQLLFIGCGLIYVWGSHIFVEKKLNSWWIYGTVSASVLSIAALLFNIPIPYKVIPPAWFGGIVLMWIGVAFFRYLVLTDIGKYITAASLILWSLLTFAMPFIIQTFPAFVAIAGGMLRLIIAVGTLLVYFEKTRTDLVLKETQYRLFTENAVDIIFRYKLLPETKFEYMSPAVFAVTGYSPEEYYTDPRTFFNSIHPDDASIVNNLFSASDHPGELPLAFRFTHKNKNTVWVEQKCVFIYNKTLRVKAIEGIIRDVTMRKQLEQIASLCDRMKMVGYMAATVAHEIRNPLTTVSGFLQHLGRKEVYQDDKATFQIMIQELDRANDIIREYLTLSKEKAIDLQLYSLNAIIESMFPLIQADAAGSRVSVELVLADIPELLLDEKEIRQLLRNLVRNGIEAMPAGGELRIRTCRENGRIALSISDQGAGIPASILEHLGTPFITTKDTGTGLGLPICYQIAARHNAVIDVTTSNQGTTFFIYFNSPRSTE
jgi:two-component system, sporulation sensor kinase C